MAIESIFRKAMDGTQVIGKTTVRENMRVFAKQLTDSVRLIADLEMLLNTPTPVRDSRFNSSVTLQPMADYHPEGQVRVIFDNITMQPIGAEIVIEDAANGP
jgi:hypothetical protein